MTKHSGLSVRFGEVKYEKLKKYVKVPLFMKMSHIDMKVACLLSYTYRASKILELHRNNGLNVFFMYMIMKKNVFD